MGRWKHNHLSSTILLTAVTESEAESFLAITWCVLVEYALASPQIEVRTVGALLAAAPDTVAAKWSIEEARGGA